MTNDDIHRIYELEALLAQAVGILLQVDSAVKALKPQLKPRKKMTKEEVIAEFRKARANAAKGSRNSRIG